MGLQDPIGGKLRALKKDKLVYANKELKNIDPRVLAVVCDAFKSEGCNTRLGHDKSYYKDWNAHGGAIETWANLCMASINNDAKVLQDEKNSCLTLIVNL